MWQLLDINGGVLAQRNNFSYTGNTWQDKFIVDFGLFVGFVDNSKREEYYQASIGLWAKSAEDFSLTVLIT